MENIEQKDLLKILDLVVKNDCEKELLELIKNGIVDEKMCQSKWIPVREELAKNGYFIDILINDVYVIDTVYEWLIKNKKLKQKHINYAIQQDDIHALLLLIKNEIVDEKMCLSKYHGVHELLASKGYFIDILINYEFVRYEAYEWLIKNNKLEQKHIDLAIKEDELSVLLLFIKNKVVDEKMCQSQHLEVHEELAKNGYFIDILYKDEEGYVLLKLYEWLVRNNKITQQHIKHVIRQDELAILLLLIQNKIVDKRMCQSQWSYVRKELAENGHFIEFLINDNDRHIRNIAYEWLIKNNKLKQQHVDQLLLNKDFKVLQHLVNLSYENNLINKDKFLQKIKEFQAEYEHNLSLLINNKNILKNNS